MLRSSLNEDTAKNKGLVKTENQKEKNPKKDKKILTPEEFIKKNYITTIDENRSRASIFEAEAKEYEQAIHAIDVIISILKDSKHGKSLKTNEKILSILDGKISDTAKQVVNKLSLGGALEKRMEQYTQLRILIENTSFDEYKNDYLLSKINLGNRQELKNYIENKSNIEEKNKLIIDLATVRTNLKNVRKELLKTAKGLNSFTIKSLEPLETSIINKRSTALRTIDKELKGEENLAQEKTAKLKEKETAYLSKIADNLSVIDKMLLNDLIKSDILGKATSLSVNNHHRTPFLEICNVFPAHYFPDKEIHRQKEDQAKLDKELAQIAELRAAEKEKKKQLRKESNESVISKNFPDEPINNDESININNYFDNDVPHTDKENISKDNLIMGIPGLIENGLISKEIVEEIREQETLLNQLGEKLEEERFLRQKSFEEQEKDELRISNNSPVPVPAKTSKRMLTANYQKPSAQNQNQEKVKLKAIKSLNNHISSESPTQKTSPSPKKKNKNVNSLNPLSLTTSLLLVSGDDEIKKDSYLIHTNPTSLNSPKVIRKSTGVSNRIKAPKSSLPKTENVLENRKDSVINRDDHSKSSDRLTVPKNRTKRAGSSPPKLSSVNTSVTLSTSGFIDNSHKSDKEKPLYLRKKTTFSFKINQSNLFFKSSSDKRATTNEKEDAPMAKEKSPKRKTSTNHKVF